GLQLPRHGLPLERPPALSAALLCPPVSGTGMGIRPGRAARAVQSVPAEYVRYRLRPGDDPAFPQRSGDRYLSQRAGLAADPADPGRVSVPGPRLGRRLPI